MRKPIRYLLYFIIGIAIFYSLKQEGNEETITTIHEYAPAIIIGVFALLLVVRSVIEKKSREK
ncbi:MAG: hypothetical protein RIC03_02705 [Cyclobacteriaceae bacterium]